MSEEEGDTQSLDSPQTTAPSIDSPTSIDLPGSSPETVPPTQRWEFMGAASTGEPISVETNSINQANDTIWFNYKIGDELIASKADCDDNRWYADGYGWYSPQSQATQDMLNYVCEF